MDGWMDGWIRPTERERRGVRTSACICVCVGVDIRNSKSYFQAATNVHTHRVCLETPYVLAY